MLANLHRVYVEGLGHNLSPIAGLAFPFFV